jgi:hypothetical protein
MTDHTLLEKLETGYKYGNATYQEFFQSCEKTFDQSGFCAFLVNWNHYDEKNAYQWSSPRHAIVAVGRQGPYWRIYDSSLPNGGMKLIDPKHIYDSLFNQQWIEFGCDHESKLTNYFDQPTLSCEGFNLEEGIKHWIIEASKRSQNANELNRHRLMLEISNDQLLIKLLADLLAPLITNPNIESHLRPIAGNITYAIQKTYFEMTGNELEIDHLTSEDIYNYLTFEEFKALFQKNFATYPPYSVYTRYLPILDIAYSLMKKINSPNFSILDIGSGSMREIGTAMKIIAPLDHNRHVIVGVDLHAPSDLAILAIDNTSDNVKILRQARRAEKNKSFSTNVRLQRVMADIRQGCEYLQTPDTSTYNVMIASFSLHQVGWTAEEMIQHLLPISDPNGCLFIHCGIETANEKDQYEIRAYAISEQGKIKDLGVLGVLDKDQSTHILRAYDYNDPSKLTSMLGLSSNLHLLFSSQTMIANPLNSAHQKPVSTKVEENEGLVTNRLDEEIKIFSRLTRSLILQEEYISLGETTNINIILTEIKNYR